MEIEAYNIFFKSIKFRYQVIKVTETQILCSPTIDGKVLNRVVRRFSHEGFPVYANGKINKGSVARLPMTEVTRVLEAMK